MIERRERKRAPTNYCLLKTTRGRIPIELPDIEAAEDLVQEPKDNLP
jgi:hypothetical protein